MDTETAAKKPESDEETDRGVDVARKGVDNPVLAEIDHCEEHPGHPHGKADVGPATEGESEHQHLQERDSGMLRWKCCNRVAGEREEVEQRRRVERERM